MKRENVNLHFVNNTKRDTSGRFEVRLPLRKEPTQLGESRCTATLRLQQLERRLKRDLDLQMEYKKFLDEYESLGHLHAIDNPENEKGTTYYLPHHPVIKPSSTTTKTRVVFDA